MSVFNNGQPPYSQPYQTGVQDGGGYYATGESSPQRNSWTEGWFAVSDPGYVKGLVIGAGLAYLLTNQKTQRALVKGAVALWTSVQGGFEEVKEQIQDIKSEMSMKKDDPASKDGPNA